MNSKKLDEILEENFTGEQYDEIHGTFIRIPFTKQMGKAKQAIEAYMYDYFLEIVNGCYEKSITDLEKEAYQTKLEPVVISKTELIKEIQALKEKDK